MLRPINIKKINEGTLGITWEDRHESIYAVGFLRENCTCANCQDEWSGEKKILPGQLPKAILPVAIDSVGQYGLKIQWNDGHATGIYTYEHLRGLCQCFSCRDKSVT